MEANVKLLKDPLAKNIGDVWKQVKSFADIGGGSGYTSIQICKQYPHLKGINCDLKYLAPVFKDYLSRENDPELRKRVSFREVDFLKEELPSDVDALVFGNVIHDWND